jgi:hypothetical protein
MQLPQTDFTDFIDASPWPIHGYENRANQQKRTQEQSEPASHGTHPGSKKA